MGWIETEGSVLIDKYVPPLPCKAGEAKHYPYRDRRLYWVNGVGIVYRADRVNVVGATVSNVSQGGEFVPATAPFPGELAARESAIAMLEQAGVYYAGIDFLNGVLTELTFDCLGGIADLERDHPGFAAFFTKAVLSSIPAPGDTLFNE